jgi:hypothetical protein
VDTDNVDTVTPLDGDGSGVTGIAEQFDRTDNEPFDPSTGNIKSEAYESQGRTTVATRRGYAFAPADKGLPVVDHTGLTTDADTAKNLVEESDGLVSIIPNEED